MNRDKRALTLNALYPAVLAIVLVGIVLGIGLYVMDQVRDNVASSYAGTDNNINVSSGSTTLGDSTLTNYKLQTVVPTWINGTSAGIGTNYSFTEPGIITWGDDIRAKNATSGLVAVNSTYTYDAPDSAEIAISTAATGLAGLASWIAIIIVVIAAAVVLGIVLSSFGREPGV